MQILNKRQEELVLKNQKFVYYLLKRYRRESDNDYDDYAQIGMVGLIKAAVTFDESKGTKFSTYAAKCINNEIKMQLRKTKNIPIVIPMSQLINSTDSDGDYDVTIEGIIRDEDAIDFIEELSKMEQLQTTISNLLNYFTRRNIIIFLLNIGGMNQQQIASFICISQSYVSRIINKITKELKQYEESEALLQNDSYKVTIRDSQIKIIFNEITIDDFSKALANLCSQDSSKRFKEFKVTSKNGNIEVSLPLHERSFEFLGRLFFEFEKLNI